MFADFDLTLACALARPPLPGFDGAQHDVGNKRYGARIQLDPRGHGAPGLDLRPEDFHEIAKKVLPMCLVVPAISVAS